MSDGRVGAKAENFCGKLHNTKSVVFNVKFKVRTENSEKGSPNNPTNTTEKGFINLINRVFLMTMIYLKKCSRSLTLFFNFFFCFGAARRRF